MFGLNKKTRIKQSIPSQLDIIPDFISATIEKLYHLPLDEDVIFNVKLCLQEAVVNAAKHGNKLNNKLMVDVDITIDGNKLIIEITDQGDGFDIASVPDPTTDENILKLQGRGVYLIKQLMGKVESRNGGRTIRMTKILKKGRRVKMNMQGEKVNDVQVIILEGEINVNNSMELRDSFIQLIKDGTKKSLVDFEKVIFIDSSGLAVLIDAVRRLKEVDGELRLSNVNHKIRGIFEITKIHKLMNFYDSRDEALQDF